MPLRSVTQQIYAVVVLAVALPGFVTVDAQAPAAPTTAFEAASIKRNKSGSLNSARNLGGGGRRVYENVTLRDVVADAYDVESYRLFGGPAWAGSDRFDIIATAGRDATPAQSNAMLRTLLADRFKLVVHDEQREMRVYALVRGRADGRLGPAIKASAADCGPTGRGRGQGPTPGCSAWLGPGTVGFEGQPIAQLATALAMFFDQPVVDRTGLKGGYDLTLSFSPEGGRGAAAPPVGTAPPPPDPNKPSLFAALQEQLGLRLESQRAPMRVVVIDSASPPTEN